MMARYDLEPLKQIANNAGKEGAVVVEKVRGLIAALVTAALVWALDRFLPLEPGFVYADIDPLYVPPIVAGLVGYLLGRSRRASFIGGVLGVILADLVVWGENFIAGRPGPVTLGAAGIFGGTVVAGTLAVLLAETVGEIRERLGGGPDHA